MLNFLKPKSNISLSLNHPAATYYLGETVAATITIDNPKNLKVQEGRAALIYAEEYQVRYEDEDSDGNDTISYRWETSEQVVEQTTIVQAGTIPGGSETYQVAFKVPFTTRPSYQGDIVKARWFVKVTLDRKMALDVNESHPITVLSVGPRRDSGGDESVQFGEASTPKACDMDFWLPSRTLVIDEPVEGKLLVRPQTDFDVTEVRLELRC